MYLFKTWWSMIILFGLKNKLGCPVLNTLKTFEVWSGNTIQKRVGIISKTQQSDFPSAKTNWKTSSRSRRSLQSLNHTTPTAYAANKAIERECHPSPTMDELVAKRNGSQMFSKLDLCSGYHQLKLSPDSQYITTFVTHVGLKRLNFGISSASEVFQNTIRQTISEPRRALTEQDAKWNSTHAPRFHGKQSVHTWTRQKTGKFGLMPVLLASVQC